MRPFRNLFFVALFCAAGISLQSCWKDKTLRDRGAEVRLDVSPTYGVPIMNLKIKGEYVVQRINKDSASKYFYIEYDTRDHDLCVIVYDKSHIVVQLPPFDTVVNYPLNFFVDLRKNEGWRPMEAYAMLYADNYYPTDFDFILQRLDYVNKAGATNSVVASPSLPRTRIVYAAVSGKPTRSLATDTFLVNNPFDIVFNGEKAFIDFRVTSLNPPGTNGKMDLNPIIKVPAHVVVDSFIRRDTVQASLGEIAKYTDDPTITLEAITLYLRLVNALPLDASLQIYFADANYTILDSLQSKDIYVKAGKSDPATYLVPPPNAAITDAEVGMSKEKFNKVQTTKYLIIREKFTSYDENSKICKDVKLFKSNYMDVILSVKVDTKINGTYSEIKGSVSNYNKK